jgi:hypothetical protein
VVRCVFARDILGHRIPAVQLADVRGVLLETGRRSRSYAAENFAAMIDTALGAEPASPA